MGFLEFWITESDSLHLIQDTLVSFFSGTVIPLFLLPAYFQRIGDFLPFKYTGFFLIDGFLGHLSVAQMFTGLGIQIAWMLGLGGLAVFMWRRGLRKYEAFGG
jgi:ABC-2 type transport system permease protein